MYHWFGVVLARPSGVDCHVDGLNHIHPSKSAVAEGGRWRYLMEPAGIVNAMKLRQVALLSQGGHGGYGGSVHGRLQNIHIVCSLVVSCYVRAYHHSSNHLGSGARFHALRLVVHRF